MGSAILEQSLAVGEVLVRQLYWRVGYRLPFVRNDGAAPAVPKHALAAQLHAIGAGKHGLLMVHSGLDRLAVLDDNGARMPSGSAALWLLATLREVVGPQGSLCMPTHPLYDGNPGFMFDKTDLKLQYSVRKTPSSVGLLTELFRRHAGTKRSHHPLSSLAVQGPLADQLLAGNLQDGEPLPHGRDSSYHRFCTLGGRVLSVGVALIRPLTVLHVAEEVRDADWPVRGFFTRRQFTVETEAGVTHDVIVRERRPEFVRALALGRVRRDLLRHGILRENVVAGARVDALDALPLLELMTECQQTSTYPYILPALAAIGKAPRATAAGLAGVSRGALMPSVRREPAQPPPSAKRGR